MIEIKPKYIQLKELPDLTTSKDLPHTVIKLSEIEDLDNHNIKYIFIKNKYHLSILEQRKKVLNNGSLHYSYYQTDFPLTFLTWFLKALTDFRKPPASGGLESGAMITNDQNVDGEMLCIKRAMAYGGPGIPGYSIVNRSRRNRSLSSKNYYYPQEISFSESFIFNGGLLELIQDLAVKYQRGEI